MIKSTQEWGDEWYAVNTQDRSGEELARYPMGCQAVKLLSDPK